MSGVGDPKLLVLPEVPILRVGMIDASMPIRSSMRQPLCGMTPFFCVRISVASTTLPDVLSP